MKTFIMPSTESPYGIAASGGGKLSAAVGIMIGVSFLACFGMMVCPGLAAVVPARPFGSLDAAIHAMTAELVQEARVDSGETRKNIRRVIAVDLFSDVRTGEVPMAGVEIERKIVEAARFRFREFEVAGLTPETAAQTDYLIGGVVERTSLKGSGPCFRIESTLIDVWSGSEIRRAEVFISAENFELSPMAIYKESPFYDLAADRTGPADSPGARPAGAVYDVGTLATRALFREAARAYQKADFARVRALLDEALKRPAARQLFAYNGLYLANRQLGRSRAAAQAIKRAMDVSIQKHGMLMMRLEFEKNSAVFPDDPSKKDTYLDWLGHVGTYFRATQDCLRIVGHASRTGSQSWNALLSRRRAKFIQKKLKRVLPDVMARSEAIGIGSRKNLIGTGTDDRRDAPDRRVEILVMDCKQMQTH